MHAPLSERTEKGHFVCLPRSLVPDACYGSMTSGVERIAMSPVINGVYSAREVTSWPLWRPGAMLDILPQLVDYCSYRPVSSANPEIRRVVDELERNGVAVMENALPPSFVQTAVQEMGHLVERMPELQGTMRTKPASTGGTREYPVHEYQQALKIYRSHDPMMFSPTYAKFLLLPQLMEVARGYLGKAWLYQAMIATRTEATGPTTEGFARWHHDARGQKLNVFLLLTDVPDDGSATIVLKGSHRLLYSRERRVRNVFGDEEISMLVQKYQWDELVCSAPAGSLVFFDSQALHRGRRSLVARDAFQVNCMNKRSHLWPQEIPLELFSSLDEDDQRTLLRRADLRVR